MNGPTSAQEPPAVIEGRRPTVPWWARVANIALAAVYIGRAVVSHRPSAAIFAVAWLAVIALLLWRPAIRVDAEGVHLSAARRSRRLIRWEQIATVDRPSAYDTVIRIRLTDGTTVALPGIPITSADAVAALGAKDLKKAPAPPPVPRPPTRSARVDEQVDFNRRAGQLQAERDRLAGELARIRGQRSRQV